jgi:hypothetical protein
MTALPGILGASVLFVLLGIAATRKGTRLEGRSACHGDSGFPGSCSLQEECDGCGHSEEGAGWWPTDGAVSYTHLTLPTTPYV